jgi:hypothetical protein
VTVVTKAVMALAEGDVILTNGEQAWGPIMARQIVACQWSRDYSHLEVTFDDGGPWVAFAKDATVCVLR